jgi:uncharacterized protein (DUF302 family)
MKRIATLAILLMLSSHTVWGAGTQQDMQAEMRKMQEAQAKLMATMMVEKRSRFGFNETVTALQGAARKRGWEIGPVMDMQEATLKAGQKGAKPFKILTMCNKDLAESLIKAQIAQKAMPFAPCRLSVFEGDDGKIYIAKPNTEFMAQMAAPAFAPLLKKLVEEENAVLANITE